LNSCNNQGSRSKTEEIVLLRIVVAITLDSEPEKQKSPQVLSPRVIPNDTSECIFPSPQSSV
jgi:hypothetical protein